MFVFISKLFMKYNYLIVHNLMVYSRVGRFLIISFVLEAPDYLTVEVYLTPAGEEVARGVEAA